MNIFIEFVIIHVSAPVEYNKVVAVNKLVEGSHRHPASRITAAQDYCRSDSCAISPSAFKLDIDFEPLHCTTEFHEVRESQKLSEQMVIKPLTLLFEPCFIVVIC